MTEFSRVNYLFLGGFRIPPISAESEFGRFEDSPTSKLFDIPRVDPAVVFGEIIDSVEDSLLLIAVLGDG